MNSKGLIRYQDSVRLNERWRDKNDPLKQNIENWLMSLRPERLNELRNHDSLILNPEELRGTTKVIQIRKDFDGIDFDCDNGGKDDEREELRERALDTLLLSLARFWFMEERNLAFNDSPLDSSLKVDMLEALNYLIRSKNGGVNPFWHQRLFLLASLWFYSETNIL